MIIKVKAYWLNQKRLYTFCLEVRSEKAKNYPYVLSATGGIVHEVYKVKECHYCEGIQQLTKYM